MAAGTDTTTAAPPDTGTSAAHLGTVGLFILLIGAFLPMTDFFIVNVALPTIDRDLDASPGMLQLVVAGYAITYALLLVVGGRVGDAVGRRRLFMIGMAGFTVTSLLCGLAPNIDLLVAARALQGAASAMMLPQVLSTIQATTSGHERSRALGMFGATGGLATVTGQLLGGVLVAANIAGTGWRPIFLVNVPVGLLGLAVAARTVPDTKSPDPAPVDAIGTVLLGVTVLGLLIPLTEGRSLGWPVWTVVLLALSPVAGVAFVVAEGRLERAGGIPLVPLSVVRVHTVRFGLAMAAPFFAGFGGFMFVYALALQDGAHFSPLHTGLTLLPMAAGFVVSSLAMPRLVARYERRVITVGALVQAVGLVSMGVVVLATWPVLPFAAWAVPVFVTGVGQGLVMVPLFRLILSGVPARQAGVGSGVLTTTQQASLAIGVAVIGSLYLTLSPAGHLGQKWSVVLTLGVLLVVAVVVSVMSRHLRR